MKTRTGTLAVLTAALAIAPAAQAAPTKVKVRVEGATKTIFEGAVTTDAHQLDGGDGSGRHVCDGTNGGANTTPGPTATGALDDAANLGNFAWTGKFDTSFSDFIVNKIGPDAATSTQFWGIAVDGKSLEVGGCQFKVAAGQEVLWAYDLFSQKNILLLSGPSKARARKAFKVRVINNADGKPVAGVRVGGKTTNAAGIAKLRYRTIGTKRLKARKPGSLRSNQLRVKVLPAR